MKLDGSSDELFKPLCAVADTLVIIVVFIEDMVSIIDGTSEVCICNELVEIVAELADVCVMP